MQQSSKRDRRPFHDALVDGTRGRVDDSDAGWNNQDGGFQTSLRRTVRTDPLATPREIDRPS